MRSGFVSIIGRPNVGKSTLLNNIVNYHVAMTSDKAGTTRNIIEGIYNDLESQIVFVDTPGINKPIDRLGKVLNKQSQSQQKEVDCILMVVDAKGGLGRGDKEIIKNLNEDFICETCVEGQEYGLDAAVINGEFNLVLLRKKEITSPPYC